MKYSKHIQSFLALSLICLIVLSSCRKNDEKYEGNYTGIERHPYLDSGATELSIDTTYNQEVDVTYSKKHYTFTKRNAPNNISTIGKKDIVNHQYLPWNSPGHLRFSGDSLYIYSTNFSDNIENWDLEVWEFKGKRN